MAMMEARRRTLLRSSHPFYKTKKTEGTPRSRHAVAVDIKVVELHIRIR